jgi:hypothetical protein
LGLLPTPPYLQKKSNLRKSSFNVARFGTRVIFLQCVTGGRLDESDGCCCAGLPRARALVGRRDRHVANLNALTAICPWGPEVL